MRRTATTPTDLEILALAKFSKAILATSDKNLINKAVIENIPFWNQALDVKLIEKSLNQPQYTPLNT